jgi:thiosulfate reductase cytochrome b subunit
MSSTPMSLIAGRPAVRGARGWAKPARTAGSAIALGRVPRAAYEARLIRLLLQWLATPLAMLVMHMLAVPEPLFWALTATLLAWLFWSVLTTARLECPYCGTSVLSRAAPEGALSATGIGLPDVCPGCAADLAAPYDPAGAAPRRAL